MAIRTDTVAMPTLSAGNEILTAHKAVANRIRNAIVAGELPGGTRLVQAELAQSLDVSITPVREALRDLIAEGLVDFDAFRAATVHKTSLAELEELYELRCTLVPMAVRAAVPIITPDQLAVAESIARAMAAELEPTVWVQMNRNFHHVLDQASGRPRLQEILSRLADLSALYVGLSISAVEGRRVKGDRDHIELVERYRARDVEGAVELALSHLGDTVEVARLSVAG